MRLENFIYVEQHGFVFTFVPKVACTNWKCVIRNILGHADYLDTAKAHGKDSGLVFLADLPGERRARVLGSSDIRKFTFVRDPYTRALSAYLNKIEPFVKKGESAGQRRYFLRIYRQVRGFAARALPEESDVSFYAFLLWMLQARQPATRDQHWLPQSEIIGSGEVEYDYVGRFENMSADVPALMGLIGATCPFPSQSDIRFPATGASERAARYIGERERDLIRKIYRRDFEALGYPL